MNPTSIDQPPFLHSIYVGLPKEITDEQGTYRTSIFRTRVEGPVQVELRGLVGDKATQPYHGTPDLAICCHPMAHYRFWNEQYRISLQPGGVGENWTIENGDDFTLCIGDSYRVGPRGRPALVQVSGPRSPCATQGRRVGPRGGNPLGAADWPALTLKETRTGFYLRVLEPGIAQPGDEWQLAERPNPGATVGALNFCYYHEWDADLAARFAVMPQLMEHWRQRFLKKLATV